MPPPIWLSPEESFTRYLITKSFRLRRAAVAEQVTGGR
jgi:hypothetical protein